MTICEQFGKLRLKLGLYQRELPAVDGSKFRAVNSDKNVYTADVLEKKLANIEQKLSRYLSELDEEDKTDAESAPDADTVKAAIAELQERKEKYIEYLTELKNSGQTQLLTTDSEARRMHSKDGFHGDNSGAITKYWERIQPDMFLSILEVQVIQDHISNI